MIPQSRGDEEEEEEEEEELAHGEIVVTTTIHRHMQDVQRHVVAEVCVKTCELHKIRVAVVEPVRPLIDIFHATHNAVPLTAPGRGTPGVRAGVVAYRVKPERCVLRETQVAEERRARVDGVRRVAVILECKLTNFLLLFTSPRSYIGLSCFLGLLEQTFFSNACFISLAWLPILVWRAKKEQDV